MKVDWRLRIKSVVEDVCGCELIKYSKQENILIARRIYCMICKVFTTHTLTEIGEVIEIDHSGVTYNIRKFKEGVDFNGEGLEDYNTVANIVTEMINNSKFSFSMKKDVINKEDFAKFKFKLMQLIDEYLT